jgi:5'-3' exoribonuclease 1
MNGVIHQCSHSSDEKLITSRDESEIFLAIFAYVQALFDKIRPGKLFFLAVDGVAPRAKMNQQRSRRFRTAAEKAEAEAKEAKKELAAQAKILNDPSAMDAISSKSVVKYFDTNCITPGTEFMERLSAHLCYFIAKRIDEDPNWRNVKIIFSGPEVPGEGEHKVMEWIRYERSQANHEPNLRHCLYGLDADLIMLGLLSHEPHFSLLREEVTFGRGKKNAPGAALKGADQVRFNLMHLGLMRNYMQDEFGGPLAESLSFEYDFELILDDFVLLSLFVGNDFLPHLPHLHINENALGLLFDAYKSTLPSLDGYLNDCGRINLGRCAQVLKNVVNSERQVFESECSEELMRGVSTKEKSSSSSLPPITPKQKAIFDDFVTKFLRQERETCWECEASLIADHPEDRVFVAGLAKDFMLILEFTEDHSFLIRKCFEDDEDEFCDGSSSEEKWTFSLDTEKIISRYEKRPILSELDPQELATAILSHEDSLWNTWKARYYAEKMEIRETKSREALLQKYCEGLEWVMAYYYEGVASWSWFFNYHYAPFLSDVIEFLTSGQYGGVQFELGRPFAPFEQLMGVLPSLSSSLVPGPLAALMTSPESPILHFFPTEFESDLNGKKNSWEAVVKIPFIDEALLVKTLEEKYRLLTETELRRNRFGDAYTFEYCRGDGNSKISWDPPSSSFEALEESRTRMVVQSIEKPPRDQLRKGLTPGVLFGLQGPPSFPSLETLPHSSALQHLSVQVFAGQASKALTLALVVTNEHVGGSPAIAFESESVHINWPHLMEAELIAITDGQRVYLREDPGCPVALTNELLQKYAVVKSSDVSEGYAELLGRTEEFYLRKRGILLAGGGSGLLAVLHPFQCLRFDANSGAIVKEFDRSRVELVPMELLIFNLPRPDERFQGRPSLREATSLVADHFELGEEVIYLSEGVSVGFVDGFVEEGRALRIRKKTSDGLCKETLRGLVRESVERFNGSFMPSKGVCDYLKIPPWLLSKLTSTLQILHVGKSVVNVGFGIKFEGRGRAVPELAKRSGGPGRWEYSRKFVEGDLREYCGKFGDLVAGLVKSGPNADRPNLELAVSVQTIDELKTWLRSRGYPVGSDSAQPCERVQLLDSIGIEALAKATETMTLKAALSQGKQNDNMIAPCRPELLLTRKTAKLYCESNNNNNNNNDSFTFNAGDRALWCGDGADGIPFACPGTIVGVFSATTTTTSTSENNSNLTTVLWFLADVNLRGVGGDLNGLLPAALKHRGIIASPGKLLNTTSIRNLRNSSNSNKAKTLHVNPLRVTSKLPFNELEKQASKHNNNNNNTKQSTPVKAQSAVEILENLFQAATLKTKGNDDSKTGNEQASSVSNTTNHHGTTESIDDNHSKSKNTKNIPSVPVVPVAPVVVIKKKPASTSGTVKISYSTKSKTTQTNQ